MRCEHCPAPEGRDCRGERTARFCTLADPSSTLFDPHYVDLLAGGGPPAPSFLKRLGNFARAAALFAADRFGLVDDATREARLEKCRACSYHDDGWCRHEDCGCLLDAKSRMASQACPIGEWGRVSGGNRACGGCGGSR